MKLFIIQDMSHDYKKNDKYRQKLAIGTKNFARKQPLPNQLNIKLITNINKIIRFYFLKATKFVNQMTPIIVKLWKENKNLQKRGKYAKMTKIGFMKTGYSKKKDHMRKIKSLWIANCISIENFCELYIKMLSYNSTKIILAGLKNLSLFFIKNK